MDTTAGRGSQGTLRPITVQPTSSNAECGPDNGGTTSLDIDDHATLPEPPKEVIGLRFRDLPLERVADDILDDAISGQRREVFFVNAHCVNVAAHDADYRSILTTTPFLFADGAGMALAARIWGQPLRHNVNGTDLLPVLCERAAREGVSLALLGGKPGVASACAEALQNSFPGLRIACHQHGYLSDEEEGAFIEHINRSGAKILLVAKGVPLQEKWARRFARQIAVPVVMGVGALFDFYSGNVRRAPKWMRRVRLEWLFRLMLEPRRLFKRYVVGNPLFVARILKLRFSSLSSTKLAD